LLHARVGAAWHRAQLVPVGIAIAAGALAWLAMDAWAPDGRGPTLLAVVVIGALATVVYGVVLWLAGAVPPRSPVLARGAPA
jgi:hypothetical protein